MEQSRTIQSFDEVKVRSTSSEAHTNVRFLSCDGHQLYERGVDLEVEGVRYIEMHRGPAAYVLGPPEPPRSREIPLIPSYRDASRAGRVRTGPA